jgi:uncharacterized membrane protein YedE/YeeE
MFRVRVCTCEFVLRRATIRGEFQRWRFTFLAGLWIGAYFLLCKWRSAFDNLQDSFTTTRAIVAGFLVGLGSSMGNGCTSGHGICGLSRLSKRSFASV